MTVKVKVEGKKAFQRKMTGMSHGVQDEMVATLNRWAIKAQKHMVKSIKQAGRGRVYKKYKPSREHQASAKGEAPASDLGFLMQNIRIVRGATRSALFAEVQSGASYSKYLEFGTRFIEPRPFVRPALVATAPAVLKDAARAIVRGMKKGNAGG